jgi:cobalt/nickel transport protein
MKLWVKNTIMLAVIVVIVLIPLVFLKGAEFSGSDDLGQQAITQINPDYKPWAFSPLEPASPEIASLLFSLQASIGTGIVCFILGRMTAKKDKKEADK